MSILDSHTNHRIRPLPLEARPAACEGLAEPCGREAAYLHLFDVEGTASRPARRQRERVLCLFHAEHVARLVPYLRPADVRGLAEPSRERQALDAWERATGLRSGY